MTRTTVHRNIEFEGLIRGCTDNQWLIADALYEMVSSPTGPSPRWHIRSQLHSSDGSPHKLSYQFQDRHLNLELSASSASALAEQIRTRFYNKRLDQ